MLDTHNQTSVSPLTMKLIAEPIPDPPEHCDFTDKLSLSVITIGYVDSKNAVSFMQGHPQNLFANTISAH